MSNGFYFVPETLYDLLQQQAAGDINGTLKKIVTDFLARSDTAALINAYQEPQPYDPHVMDGDAFDYPTFWRAVDKAGLDAKPGTSRDTVMAAALQHHFNSAAKATATPANDQSKGPDAKALENGLPVPIEQNLYARIRKQSLETGASMADIMRDCVDRYLRAPAAFEAPLRSKVGDTLTIFTYRPTADELERIDAVLHLHTAPLQRVDRRDLVALAIDADFRRQDMAVAAGLTAAQRRRAMLRPDPRFKL